MVGRNTYVNWNPERFRELLAIYHVDTGPAIALAFERAGCELPSRSTIKGWLTCERAPSRKWLSALALALGLTEEEIVVECSDGLNPKRKAKPKPRPRTLVSKPLKWHSVERTGTDGKVTVAFVGLGGGAAVKVTVDESEWKDMLREDLVMTIRTEGA